MPSQTMREPATYQDQGEVLVCGLDISARRAGIAVLSGSTYCQTYLVGNTQRDPTSVAGRQRFAGDVLARVLRALTEAGTGRDAHVFIEGVIHVRNVRTALDAAYLVGAIETSLCDHLTYLNVHHVNVSTWKSTVFGTSKASKDDIQRWYQAIYGEKPLSQDEADATAIAKYGQVILARPLGQLGE